ncbi:MAG: hypothetical protein JRI35_02115 [Deltaproteobacteria bacterium]|nr:hypothetical protein [Deltaproteobacteria bacterium]
MINKKTYLYWAWIFILLSALIFFVRILNLWVFSDDIVAILHSFDSIEDTLFKNPYSNVYYTPLAVLAFKPDLWLFGLSPLLFHVHNFVLLLLISLFIFLILKEELDDNCALFGAVLTLFSTPSLVMVSCVVLRQYLYPSLFSLISVYLFLKYRPTLKNKPYLVILIVLLCELSFIGKEQFMTLPFLLFVISEGDLKKRIFINLPYFLTLLVHFMFRAYVLKGLGGYPAMSFSLDTYLITLIKSYLMVSKIMFGNEAVIIFVVFLLLLSSYRKIILLFSVWICALSIQFLTMYNYPDITALRYWFVAVVVVSVTASYGLSSMKNNTQKWIYASVILSLFMLNSLSYKPGVEAYFIKKSVLYGQASSFMLDKRHDNSTVLIFDDYINSESLYFKCIDAIYSEKLGIKTYSAFMPADFLIFYPELMSHDGVFYEMTKSGISDITTSVKDRLKEYKKKFYDDSPPATLIKDSEGDNAISVSCCGNAKGIIMYVVTVRRDKFKRERAFYDKIGSPYYKEEGMKLRTLTKLKKAEFMLKNKISNTGSVLRIGNRRLKAFPEEALVMFSCIYEDGRSLHPSSLVLLKN